MKYFFKVMLAESRKQHRNYFSNKLIYVSLFLWPFLSFMASYYSYKVFDIEGSVVSYISGGNIMVFLLIAKPMFYPKDIQRQIDELNTFLQPEQYQQIHDRMKQKGFRQGFACLFYGGPGTGKTETVYQLARQTGRQIMVVDVQQIKSKWVGDSEKNIKALFDRYREQVKRAKLAPILLFNEADAIIGIRQEGAQRAVDKMENSIQNIILQEMETLDGIMIATTNLQQNLDSAFERRFLYKIKFEKPDAAVRTKIWQQMIPELSKPDASQLAETFDFSGGQIENIARKFSINGLLHGDVEKPLEILTSYCSEERIQNQTNRKIGF